MSIDRRRKKSGQPNDVAHDTAEERDEPNRRGNSRLVPIVPVPTLFPIPNIREQHVLTARISKTKTRTMLSDDFNRIRIRKNRLIKNERLEKIFNAYKKKKNAYNETLRYLVVHNDKMAQRIAEEGLCTGDERMEELGDPRRGVVLYNSPEAAYTGRYLYNNLFIRIMVFRVVVEEPPMRVPLGSKALIPSVNHTSHALDLDDFTMFYVHPFLQEHYKCAVYHYEYEPNSRTTKAYPTMILPHAYIIYQLSKHAVLATTNPSRIDPAFWNFVVKPYCKHKFTVSGKEIELSVCIQSFMKTVPPVLCNTTSKPIAHYMDDLSAFPELGMLRSPTTFGKLLSTDAVQLPNSTLAAYFLLKFPPEYDYLIHAYSRDHCMLVWTSWPFKVFYIPPGHVPDELGLPPMEHHMHLIVLCNHSHLPRDMEVSMYCQTIYWNTNGSKQNAERSERATPSDPFGYGNPARGPIGNSVPTGTPFGNAIPTEAFADSSSSRYSNGPISNNSTTMKRDMTGSINSIVGHQWIDQQTNDFIESEPIEQFGSHAVQQRGCHTNAPIVNQEHQELQFRMRSAPTQDAAPLIPNFEYPPSVQFGYYGHPPSDPFGYGNPARGPIENSVPSGTPFGIAIKTEAFADSSSSRYPNGLTSDNSTTIERDITESRNSIVGHQWINQQPNDFIESESIEQFGSHAVQQRGYRTNAPTVNQEHQELQFRMRSAPTQDAAPLIPNFEYPPSVQFGYYGHPPSDPFGYGNPARGPIENSVPSGTPFGIAIKTEAFADSSSSRYPNGLTSDNSTTIERDITESRNSIVGHQWINQQPNDFIESESIEQFGSHAVQQRGYRTNAPTVNQEHQPSNVPPPVPESHEQNRLSFSHLEFPNLMAAIRRNPKFHKSEQ